jgi:NAD(P)-dependent dehydrogenase (short-subunit alcohol dehydrogenase family)
MYNLEGKVALVTGGASGIGRAIALRLASEGCDVGLFDSNAEGAAETANMVQAAGRRAATASGDVGDRRDVDAGAKLLTDALNTPDILVNCAGILRVGKLLEQSYKDFSDQFRVNVDGTFHFNQAIVPAMVARRSGVVVNMSSWLGKKGMAYYGGYAASKFAVIAMTQTLALEVAEAGVRVNAVCPGTIDQTGMRSQAETIHKQIGFPSAESRIAAIPLRRLGTPEDIARITAFLASDQSEFMTGQAINVTGGFWMN